MSRRLRVYIAAAYTGGDIALNVKTAMDAAAELIEHGYAPYVPHLSHFIHMAHPQPYETWMRLDFEWIAACDAMIRLPGESPGADREVAAARARGMTVYASVADFLRCPACGTEHDQ